ncbi:MAG: hypothetical protein AAGE80_17000 [Pseudomonadota bacterium]
MIRALLIAVFLAGCTAEPPADPLQGEPIVFALPDGRNTTIDRLIVLTPSGAQGAPIPRRARSARNEDRVDLGRLPVLGDLFGGRRVTRGDAERDGFPLGPVFLSGTALVVDLSTGDAGMLEREVIITTLLDGPLPPGTRIEPTTNPNNDDAPRSLSGSRSGVAVRYDLGIPQYRLVPGPQAGSQPVGRVFFFNESLVIASEGTRPGLIDFFDLLF